MKSHKGGLQVQVHSIAPRNLVYRDRPPMALWPAARYVSWTPRNDQGRVAMIKGVHHTAFSTTDMDRLLLFYCDLLGAEKLSDGPWGPGNEAINRILGLPDTGGRSAMLKLGNLHLELWQFDTPKPAPRDLRPPASSLGLTHICLEVDDVDAEYERLCRAGIQFHAKPGTFGTRRATYGRDPDGNIFEILQDLAC